MHLPPPVPDSGDLSSAVFTSPPIPSPKSTESGTFSAARSGSVFTTSAYADPYSTETQQEELGPGRFPRSPGQHILPSSSTRDEPLSISDSTKSGTTLANVTSPTRHRFALPSFPRTQSRSRTTSATNSHRGAHPKGPADLEETESEALVSREDRQSDEEGDDELGGRLEQYDTRDQL
jgi:hypothetical protein